MKKQNKVVIEANISAVVFEVFTIDRFSSVLTRIISELEKGEYKIDCISFAREYVNPLFEKKIVAFNLLPILVKLLTIPFSTKLPNGNIIGGGLFAIHDVNYDYAIFDINKDFLKQYRNEIYDAIILNFNNTAIIITDDAFYLQDITEYTNENQTK